MKQKEKTRTESVLKVMPVLAWLVCMGFVAVAGAVLISFAVSWVHSEAAKNLYMGLDLYGLRQYNAGLYVVAVAFQVALPLMKAWVAYLLVRTLSTFKLQNPFTPETVKYLEKISYFLFATWVVAMLSNIYTSLLKSATGTLYGNWISGEFIFMVALVFVLAQVFKRGVEIQSENELTV